MTQEQLWHDFETLPPAAQREVEDFIAFLKARYDRHDAAPTAEGGSLREEPFIGMWAARDDMTPSSEWVRQHRSQEWG